MKFGLVLLYWVVLYSELTLGTTYIRRLSVVVLTPVLCLSQWCIHRDKEFRCKNEVHIVGTQCVYVVRVDK